jgi:hypothetical protein
MQARHQAAQQAVQLAVQLAAQQAALPRTPATHETTKIANSHNCI